MTRQGRVHIIGLIVLVLTAAGIAGCGGSSGGDRAASASDVARSYVKAWNRADYDAMNKLLAPRQPNFAEYQQQVLKDLDASAIAVTAGAVREEGHGAQAVAKLTNHITTAFGELDADGTLVLVKQNDKWRVQWSTQQLHNSLLSGTRFSTSTQWPERAPVLGANGQPLTVLAPMVRVGIQGSRITDVGALTSALALAGAAPSQINTAIATANQHPDWFVEVTALPDADYQKIRAQIFPVPGTLFRTYSTRVTITSGLAAHLVGRTGPITAELLQQLGSPYTETDTVGRAGIEAQYEKQLAGSPGATIAIVDANDQPITTLATFPAKPGTAVQTTIDPTVQNAAEAALFGINGEAAIVAVRASTGEVLASTSTPLSNGYDIALRGQYPPGSTFKIITTADLLEHGYNASSVVTCPATLTISGQTFRNFEGEAAASLSLLEAFEHSCNNAFIGSAKDLPTDSLPTIAKKFGLGNEAKIGVDAFGGSVPLPTTPNEQAATSIGQSKVTASPLAMAGVAAAVASGSWHAPRLVAGAPNDSVASVALDAGVVQSLQQMMAAVVSGGTASGARLPPGTFGKTGTAEFGNASPPQTHAWFVGYRGDVAFAVIVPGGGVGGAVAAPIAARFLNQLPG